VSRRQNRRPRIVRLLLLLTLLAPLLAGSYGQYSAPPNVAGDELSEALAKQKALAAKIAAQKAAIARMAALQTQLASDIASTRTALDGINQDLSAVVARVTRTTADVNEAKAQYLALVTQIASLDADIVDTIRKETVKTAELNERKATLAARLRAAYAAGETSLLETLLSARSFADALADVGYYLDIGDQDKALAEQIKEDEATLATYQATLQGSRDEADLLRVQTAAQKKKLDAKLAELKVEKAQLARLQKETKHQLAIQAAAYKRLSNNKAALRKALHDEAAERSELKKKIDKLIAQQYARGNIPSSYNGTLSWPVHGVVTQEFGCTGFIAEPPYGSCPHFHNGIDIAAPMYTPIHAAGPGRVVFVGPLSDGAWVVIIAHSQKLVTLYGHVDAYRHPPRVHAGQFVSKGTTIAYVGMTGNTTGPHLHWSVELNDTWVNPRLFL
jgi:murein DD-endopeptidase MepM/ murein hydrolase activator NlpD